MNTASSKVKIDSDGEPAIEAIVGFPYPKEHNPIFEAYFKYRAKDNVARANLGYSLEDWKKIVADPIIKKGFAAIKDYIIGRLEALYIEKAEAGDGNAVRAVLSVHSDEWGDGASKHDEPMVPKFDERGHATWMNK